MNYHHHGTDGECHSGPGGMFYCARCEFDSLRAEEAREERADQEGWRQLGDGGDQP